MDDESYGVAAMVRVRIPRRVPADGCRSRSQYGIYLPVVDRWIKEQNGNRCYYCGAEVEDMSGVGESQLPVCLDCVAKGLPVSSGQ